MDTPINLHRTIEKTRRKNLKKKAKKILSSTPKKEFKKNSTSNSEKKAKNILSPTLKKNYVELGSTPNFRGHFKEN